MSKFKKFINITTIPFIIMGIVIVVLAYYEAKSDLNFDNIKTFLLEEIDKEIVKTQKNLMNYETDNRN